MAAIASQSQADAPAASASTHRFTCVTCAIAFRSSELQRNHMKSDWHRYNLKRRVASLPPLSSEVFAEKVLSAQATSSAAAAKASFEKTCTACQRTYYSENAYQNHVGSAKHKQRLLALEHSADTETASVMSSTISLGEPLGKDAPEDVDDSEVEEEFTKVVQGLKEASINAEPVSRRPSRPHHSSNEDRPESQASAATTTDTAQSNQMPIHRCLFCNYDSPNLKLSVMHMTKFHGLFIPEKDYLDDIEGLIKYLQAKVVENYECICCHKLKGSMHGVQTHMRDLGHCRIAFETEEEMIEIGQFYDFRSTYSDEDEDDDDDDDESEEDSEVENKGVKLGARRSSGNKGENEEEGWETDSDDSVATDELTSVPIDPVYDRLDKHKHHSHSDHRSHRAADGFHSHAHQHHAVFYSDYELHLPNGRTAGHRSLNRYFRQNLHNHPSEEERHEQLLLEQAEGETEQPQNSRGRDRQLARREDQGMVGVTDQKKKEVVGLRNRAQQRAQRAERRFQNSVGMKANNQKHFRDDNFGTHI